MGFREKFQKIGLFFAVNFVCLLTTMSGAEATGGYCDNRISRLGAEVYARMSDLVEIKVGRVNGKPAAKLRLKDVLDTYQFEGIFLEPGKVFGLRGYVTSFNPKTNETERHHVATLIATVDNAKRISWAVRLSGQQPAQLSGRDEQVMCGMSSELSGLFREIERQGSDLFDVRDVDVSSPKLLAHVLGKLDY